MSRLGGALERAGTFLLEPAPATAQPPPPASPAVGLAGPVSLAVVGLSPESGARTLAVGLALALGRRGDRPFLVSLGPAPPVRGAVRACEVPAALTGADEVACYGGTLLRLAGAAAAASSVWSVPAREAPRAASVIADVDAVIAVAGRGAEPALSGMVCALLAERCRRVLMVANSVGEREPWAHWAAACLPESRLGAAMLGRGRFPGGRLGRSLLEVTALAAGVATGGLAPHHGLFTGRRQ